MTFRRLTVVGPGRVGRSLAGAVEAAGTFRSVRVLGRRDPVPTGASGPEFLVFCVPDDALAALASAWGAALGATERPPRGVALHTSGLHAADILEPLRAAGVSVGSWHPLRAFAAPDPSGFNGITVGLEGDEEAVRAGDGLARTLGARPLLLTAKEKPRYHAAAVFASNHLVACLSVALRELRGAAGEKGTLRDLLPLARSALEAVEQVGLTDGVTGPVVRGDAGTVERHLQTLDASAAALYRGLASELLRLAGAEVPDTVRERLLRLLATAAPGPETDTSQDPTGRPCGST